MRTSGSSPSVTYLSHTAKNKKKQTKGRQEQHSLYSYLGLHSPKTLAKNSLSESAIIQLRPDTIHTTVQKGEGAAIPFPENTENTRYSKTNIKNTYILRVKTHFRCRIVA